MKAVGWFRLEAPETVPRFIKGPGYLGHLGEFEESLLLIINSVKKKSIFTKSGIEGEKFPLDLIKKKKKKPR